MKCLVCPVADIVADESVYDLVEEMQPNFATEFLSVLRDLDVVRGLKFLVSEFQDINSCIVPVNNIGCTNFDGLERKIRIKSIAFELTHLPHELLNAIEGLL